MIKIPKKIDVKEVLNLPRDQFEKQLIKIGLKEPYSDFSCDQCGYKVAGECDGELTTYAEKDCSDFLQLSVFLEMRRKGYSRFDAT